MHILVPLLPQRSPLYVFVLIALDEIIFFLDGVSKINQLPEDVALSYIENNFGFHAWISEVLDVMLG